MSMVKRSNNLKSSDVDRFAAFKAQKEAKKELERQKLAAEFPLLFGKDVNKSKNIRDKYTVLKSTNTPSKRKVSQVGKSDENAENFNATATSVSTLDCPNSVSKKKAKIVKPSVKKTKETKTSFEAQKARTAVPQKSSTFLNFSFSSAQTPEPVEPNEVEMVEDVKQNSLSFSMSASDLTIDPADVDKTNSAQRSPVASALQIVEQVQDVLDYLLELKEVDQRLYRRLSRQSQNFTAEKIRKLSAAEPEVSEVQDTVVLDAMRTLINNMSAFDTVVETGEASVDDMAEIDKTIQAVQEDVTVGNSLVQEQAVPPVDSLAERTSTVIANDARDMISPLATKKVSWNRLSVVPMSVTIHNDNNEGSSDLMTHMANSRMSVLLMSPNSDKVLTNPRAELLEDVMKKGLLTADVTKHMMLGNYVKYLIDLKSLPMGNDTEGFEALLLKRYSEFKSFRSHLLSALSEDKHSLIPALPGKDLNCKGEASEEQEAALTARKVALNAWMKEILSLQSALGKSYRDKITTFITM